MHLSTRSCTKFINGVENFHEYAFTFNRWRYEYRYHRILDEVQYHILFRGIRRDYTTWYIYVEGDSEEEGDNDDGM